MIQIMIVTLVATLALSGAPRPAKPKLSRLQIINEAMTDRMSRQHDIWFEQGEFPKDVQLLKMESELEPSNYDTWTNLGWMQENIKQYPDAEATYNRYRVLNPNDPDRSLPIAEYWFRKRNFTEAIRQIEGDLDRKVHPNAFRIVANAYDRLKKYPDSIRVWHAYLKRAPNDLSAKANLNRVEKKNAAR
jgi:tetratricopeptide (TPR) repeat protein